MSKSRTSQFTEVEVEIGLRRRQSSTLQSSAPDALLHAVLWIPLLRREVARQRDVKNNPFICKGQEVNMNPKVSAAFQFRRHSGAYHIVATVLMALAATGASAQNWHPGQSIERFRIHPNGKTGSGLKSVVQHV
jgi:hypothetical protein